MSNDIQNLVEDRAKLSVLSTELPFVPFIRLMQHLSPACTAGQAKFGEFVLGNINLGQKFRGIVVAHQWAAVQLKANKVVKLSNTCIVTKVKEPDPFTGEIREMDKVTGDEVFAEIANGEDDQKQQILNRWGLKFLIAIPDHASWGVLFLNSKTSRRRAPEFLSPAVYRRPSLISSQESPAKALPRHWSEPTCRALTQDEILDGGWESLKEGSYDGVVAKFLSAPKAEEVAEAVADR